MNKNLFLLLVLTLMLGCKDDPEPNPIPLKADFTTTSPTLNKGIENHFIDQSQGDIDRYEWIFEGGSPEDSNEQNPSINFESLGLNEITLIVSNVEHMLSDTLTKSIMVYPGDNLLAYFPLDGSAEDYSQNDNHAVQNGTTNIPNQNGDVDEALQFNGIDDNISIPNKMDDKMSNGLSFSAWVVGMDSINTGSIISNRSEFMPDGGCKRISGFDFSHSFIRGIELVYHRGTVHFGWRSNDKVKMEMGVWYHILATWDGDLTGSGVKLYIDGEECNSSGQQVPMNECGYTESDQPFTIGGRQLLTSPNRNFTGYIDEVRIYNRPLTKSEIEILTIPY